jgi:nicotinamidase-related amidase
MKRVSALMVVSWLIASPGFAVKSVNGVATLNKISELADPAHSAVIVIDMQNEIVSTQGGYNRPDRSQPPDPARSAVIPRFQEQIKRLHRLLSAARQRHVAVIYTEYIHCDSSGQMLVNGPECWCHLREPWVSCVTDGTWEAAIIQDLAPNPAEVIIKKSRGDSFYRTYLDDILREKGITNVLLTGTAGGGCVLATAFGAMERGYYPVLVIDCVDQERFVQLVVKGRWPIYSSDQIMGVWNAARPKPTSSRESADQRNRCCLLKQGS